MPLRPVAPFTVRQATMASENANPLEPGGQDPAVDLDSRLRSLALANLSSSSQPGLQDLQPNEEAQPSRPVLHSSTGRETSAGFARRPDPPSRASKRRPNQAQRRQMSSQLSIPTETRPRQLPHGANFNVEPPARGYNPRSDQRYQKAAYHSTAIPPVRQADAFYGSTPSNVSSRNHSAHLSWNANMGPYSRQVPSSVLQQDLSSAQNPRYGLRPPQTQRRTGFRPEDVASQVELLEGLCLQVIPRSEIQLSEIGQKENFRQRIETICRSVIARHEQDENGDPDFHPSSVDLKCFGSLSSGFATKTSDMDLGLLSPMSKLPPDATESPIPRLLEKALLDAGLGARLLSRTRVPIIKLCEEPPEPLRKALLAEREKWESGVENETSEGAVDEEFEHETIPSCNSVANPELKRSDVHAPVTELEIPCGDAGGVRRFNLRQGPNHTLAAYYGLAKRLLRRAGGKDVTVSNHRDFTAADWTILNRVCQAFIQGLSDPLLQQRVARYPSLSFMPKCNMPNNRSLHGVFTQVEGEHALQIWETWSARDELHDTQAQAGQALSSWNGMQWRENYGVDPVQYTKDLQMALDRIKRIPSFQLLLLEQGQHETPSQYFARTQGILKGLRYRSQEESNALRLEIVNRYISGVAQNDVRGFLEDVVAHSKGEVNLEAVSLRHKTFHLSRQLESALEKGALDAGQARDVADYTALLRSPPCRVYTGPADCRVVIPVPPESVDLLLRIRNLEDMHNVASNQPKDRYRDHLEFPTSGAGVQCDINFSAHLALHNTALLRCYSHTDPRVRPMVLFVKHWAKVRGINSGYRGTLSSYGYVLMVLHYLVNVAQPFVCPNLQHLAPRPSPDPSPVEVETTLWCRNRNIQFWRNEREILHLASTKQLNHNTESLENLLRGFFEYFAHTGFLSTGMGKGFDWGRDVLSLRTQGGLLSKQEKGWTGAKTVFEVQGATVASKPRVEQGTASGAAGRDVKSQQAGLPKKVEEVKEIRHRYLFAIEDPFELDHNVARTVTHNGIVSIRDEFRRAWRIIRTAGSSVPQEDLLQDVKDFQEGLHPFFHLVAEIHGPEGTWGAVA